MQADGRANRRTDMTKLMVVFRKFASAPMKFHYAVNLKTKGKDNPKNIGLKKTCHT